MIEEYDEFLKLKNYLNVSYEFVHGSTSAEVRQVLPEKYWKQDNQQIFKDFNDGKVKCLIGTSSIGVGVDLKPVGAVIYLQGGCSLVKVRQSVGRGSRPVGSKDCFVVDFKVLDGGILERHAEKRLEIYEEISDDITLI